MSVTDYTRERDLRIVTDSETEYESEAEAIESIEPPKRTKITKLKKEAVTPRRSPRNANKRRTIMTRSTKTDSLWRQNQAVELGHHEFTTNFLTILNLSEKWINYKKKYLFFS